MTTQGSRDPVGIALAQQENEIEVEAALPPRRVELSAEQKDFAARLITKLNRTLRPEARRSL